MDGWTDGVKYRAAYTKVLLILRIISDIKMGTQTEMAKKEYLTRGGKGDVLKPYQRLKYDFLPLLARAPQVGVPLGNHLMGRFSFLHFLFPFLCFFLTQICHI